MTVTGEQDVRAARRRVDLTVFGFFLMDSAGVTDDDLCEAGLVAR